MKVIVREGEYAGRAGILLQVGEVVGIVVLDGDIEGVEIPTDLLEQTEDDDQGPLAEQLASQGDVCASCRAGLDLPDAAISDGWAVCRGCAP